MDILDPTRVLAEALVRLLRGIRITAEMTHGGVPAISVSVARTAAIGNVDERLAKIEVARQSLTEALEAMEALKEAAEENKRDLAYLSEAITNAEKEKASLDSQLDTLKSIAALDSGSVRQALRLPSAVDIWRDRIIAFALGVIASIIATIAWELLLKKLF